MLWDLLALVVGAVILAILVRASLVRHVVWPGQVGLLYRKEKFVRSLEPGAYSHFDPFRQERLVTVLTVPTALHQGQYDVISKDQFAFRLMIAPMITITDPRAFHEETPPLTSDYPGIPTGPEMRFTRLTPVIAAGVMAAVAEKTLEEFLADPAGALEGVAEQVAAVLPGTQLDRLAITSVTLPPEVRKMFTEVERARREGLAGLERAKAEQASLRALANAARNLAGNPQLAQLRMLQTMESAKGAKTFVLGNPADMVPGEEPGAS